MSELISLDQIFSEIESPDFYANIAIVDNLDSFLFFADNHRSIVCLKSLLSINPENQDHVIERAKVLFGFKCDPSELHPYDHSIAIYLYTLFKTNKFKVESLMEYISQNRLPNLYWTYHVYNFILRNLPRIITSYCDASQVQLPEKFEPIDVSSFHSANKT
jgi:hypothetical protein